MISSRHNPRIKAAALLYKRAERERCGTTLVEGYRQILRAVEAGVLVIEVFYSRPLWLGAHEEALLARAGAAGAELIETTAEVFAKLSMRDRPDGLAAIARLPRPTLAELALRHARHGRPPLYVVVEGIEKPGNLGAILRSCDGAGCDGVLVCDRVTDIANPNVVRSSVGTIFSVPVVEVAGATALTWLAEQALGIVVAAPAAQHLYTGAPLGGSIALVCGSEQYGLSPFWLAAPGALAVSIPMRGRADSLNVAQACTLLVYEALRQRSGERRVPG